MRIAPLVTFASVVVPGDPGGPIGVRADSVLVVVRARLNIEPPPNPAAPNMKRKVETEGTMLTLVNGRQLFVQELVEEVNAKLREAGKPRFLGWLWA